MIGYVVMILARTNLTETDEHILSTEGLPYTPFHLWNEDDWDMFAQYLSEIANNLKRQDANAAVHIDRDEEDATIVPARSEHELFTGRVNKIHRYIQVFKALCPIRAKLTEQLEDEEMDDDDYPKIHKKSVEKVW